MAIWGSGTLEDPWKVTDWDNFVSRCNETNTGESERSYIEFPTHDQNGNLIPVEERVIDMRHREWYVGENSGNRIIDLLRFKTVEGNGWTILGLSIRNISLFYISRNSSNSSSKNRNRNFELNNLNFQNIYVHGKCLLFRPNVNGSRCSISGCKFSGVFDASITDVYSGSTTDACGITYGSSYFGMNVFTACSFNFKFISGIRIEYIASGSGYYSSEFNNCIFNVEGKPKPYNQDLISSSAYECGRYHLWYSSFYFCKFTGKLLIDCADSYTQSVYLGTFFNRAGSLNVIDIALRMITTQYDFFNYYYYLCYESMNNNEVTIRYFDRTELPVGTGGFDFRTNKANVFKIPANREQMTNKDWLEDQGFVIGTAPTI